MSGVKIGSFALWGEPDNESGRKLIVAIVGDELILEHGIPKSKREQLQFESFAGAVEQYRGSISRPGDDPPDLIVTIGDHEIGVELTQLSIRTLRADVAHAAGVAAMLRARLNARATDYPHLLGRTVDIRLTSVPPRRDYAKVVDALADTLKEDVGFIGEGLTFAEGELPERIDNFRGFYGLREDGALISVQSGDDPNMTDVIVTPGATVQVKIAEVEAQVEALIAKKDRPGNDVLLISTGVPDHNGAAFPIDGHLFESLRAYDLPRATYPHHLNAVYLHHWPSFEYRRLYPPSE